MTFAQRCLMLQVTFLMRYCWTCALANLFGTVQSSHGYLTVLLYRRTWTPSPGKFSLGRRRSRSIHPPAHSSPRMNPPARLCVTSSKMEKLWSLLRNCFCLTKRIFERRKLLPISLPEMALQPLAIFAELSAHRAESRSLCSNVSTVIASPGAMVIGEFWPPKLNHRATFQCRKAVGRPLLSASFRDGYLTGSWPRFNRNY